MEEKLEGVAAVSGKAAVKPSFSSVDPAIEVFPSPSHSNPPECDLETARAFVGSQKGNCDQKLLSMLKQLGMLLNGERGLSGPDQYLEKASQDIDSAIQCMKRRVSKTGVAVLTR